MGPYMMNKKIFILEDDIDICNIYINFFKTNNICQVNIYHNIEEAVNAIKDNGIDYWNCFLCDLKVPLNAEEKEIVNFNTFDFIEKYLEPCKTVVVSGYMSPEIKEEMTLLGVVALHTKPIDLNLLLITLNSIVDCR